MLLRKRILPKSKQDALVTLFILLIIPLVYWFELFVVLPSFYKLWSPWYTFHFVMGSYIMVNVASNYMAIVMCDTSIRGRILSDVSKSNWHFCAVCESLVPPRSWHCSVCDVCILKRDHHCMFTSCCIGHHNQRYFLMFVLYIFVSTLYATYYNSFFIWRHVDFHSYASLVKVVFPLAMLFLDQTYNQTYLLLYMIIVIGCVFTGVLFYYHLDLVLCGMVTYERNNKLHKYDLGKRRNLEEVLGERWYLVWISPFVASKLPHDGIHWDTKDFVKEK